MISGGSVRFLKCRTKCRTVHGSCNSHSDCNPVAAVSSMTKKEKKKKATTKTALDCFFSGGWRELNPQGTRSYAINVRHEGTATCPLSPIADDPSALPSPPPQASPVSNSSCLFTRCLPLRASPCILLLYFLRYCAVRSKMFYFWRLFMYCLCKTRYSTT